VTKKKLKTFNINEEVYSVFSDYCKREGMSMSRKIEKFMEKEIEFFKSGVKEEVVSGKKRNLSLGDKKVKISGDDKDHAMGKYC